MSAEDKDMDAGVSTGISIISERKRGVNREQRRSDREDQRRNAEKPGRPGAGGDRALPDRPHHGCGRGEGTGQDAQGRRREDAQCRAEGRAGRLDDAEARARELEEQLSTAAQEERARAAAEIERLKTAAEKEKAKAEKLAAERDKAQLRVEGMQQDFDTFADAQEKLTAELERAQAALKKAEAEMEERIEREAGAIGAMRAEQAVEAVKAQAAAEIAELQKRGDPEIAAARVLFDSILENANRLRSMMLRAEGDKQEHLRSILRAISTKIAEGL